MNKELQIDDLTRGINDDGPVFNETERWEPEVQSSEAREQDTALPDDKCWQDFLSYLEAPTDGDGKAGRLVCKLDRDLADSLDDCDIRGRCRSDLVQTVWYANSTATWPTRLTTATSVAAAVPTS